MSGITPATIHELDRLYPLGANVDIPDERDYDLRDFLDSASTEYGSKRWHWPGQAVLDQGEEGACVLFGTAQALNCEPRRRKITSEIAKKAYHYVTENDNIPGTWRSGQAGSYPRDGAEYWREKGLFQSYAFSRSSETMVRFLLSVGPICMSSDWLISMERPQAADNYYARVDYSRGVRGRHLYCIAGVEWPRRGERFFVVLNSWGKDRFGYEGRCRISEAGMAELLKRNVNNTALTFVEGTKKGRKK